MRELYELWPSILKDEQINNIIEVALQKPAKKSTIFSSNDSLQSVRKSSIRWLPEEWIKDLLWEYIKKANVKSFNFNVEKNAEVQFTEYHSNQRHHYDWHHDIDWNSANNKDRKLSITVQLSDGNDYKGGDFEFDEVKTNADFKSKGTILIFPSYLRHRVLPVTSGTRRSLVAWFYGPKWK